MRSLTIDSEAASPTPLIAARPKRTSPLLFVENLTFDSLTSGPSTAIPMLLHSLM